jgi:hypothetical protein
MGKAERETMTELETTAVTERPPRGRAGPKPKQRPGPKPRAAVLPSANGHVNGARPITALLRDELATVEARASQLRRALAALEG